MAKAVRTQEPTHFLVRALPPQGFHRAGRFWPAEETRVAAQELSEAQIAALLAEPKLVVIAGVDSSSEPDGGADK